MYKRIITSLLMLIHLPLLAQVDSLYMPSSELLDSINNSYELEQLTVTSFPSPMVNDGGSQYQLRFDKLEQIPQFFGTIDGVRALQLLPGIQTTGDIASGLYVQGCEPSHNLFLIDNAPVYSPTHLLGFIPVLNSNHMDRLSVEKGYISPLNGGRLAAVVESNSRDDIPEKPQLSGEINLITASLTLNSPTSDKGNLIVSSRACYVNGILSLIELIGKMPLAMGYNMYDFNGSWNYKFSEKDKISISGYYGCDKANLYAQEYLNEGVNRWENSTASINWHHNFSEKSKLQTTLYNTTYRDNIYVDQSIIRFNLTSQINDFGAKLVHKLNIANSLSLAYGADFAHRTLSPQTLHLYGLSSAFEVSEVAKYKNIESAAFVEADINLSKKVSTTLGARYSGVFGESSGFEPRLNLSYSPNSQINTTFSYTRQYQYINQVIVSNTGLPVNFFTVTTKDSPAQRSDNLSLQLFYKTKNNRWSVTSLLYYKWLQNQYEYNSKLTSILIEDTPFYDRFEVGKGHNYGFEAMVRWNLGKFTGWASYTLGWAIRECENINNGKPFYAGNDRRHDLSVVGTYSITPKWRVSSNFIYASGTPITQATGLYIAGGLPVSNYAGRNLGRLPVYTRLDVSAVRKLKIRWFSDSAINFSIYNIYARRNPLYYSYTIGVREDELKVVERGNAIFTILPSVGLTFKM